MITTRAGRLSRAEFLKLAGGAAAAIPFAQRAAFGAAPALVSKPVPKSKNGERLPVVGLGTSLDDVNKDAVTQVIKELVAGGGRVLDTAESYGESEAICGEAMEQQKSRPQIFVASKFGEPGTSIEGAFKSLRTDVIDLMYIHNMIDVDNNLSTLRDYKAKNRIRYLGVTSTGANQDRLTIWMDQMDFVEFAYSVDYRSAEKKLLPAALDKGVAVFVALPFGRSRLLNVMKGKEVPAWAREELGCTSYAQLALKFVISHPAVTVAIPGTQNPKHMAENLAAGITPLADEKQREKIAALWEKA